jgi:hypothetical protein
MSDLLGSLVQGAKSGHYCIVEVRRIVTYGIRAIDQPEIGGTCISP